MISLINPFFLAFGAAVIIPLVLHLMQSRRTVRLPFSTIRFLKLAQQRSSRRMKMENFLLWLLRTLLIVLLVLAFAMPLVRTRDYGNLLGRATRDVAIVVDASYSLNYTLGRQAVWNQATDLAASIIEGLSEKDRFCVFLAGDQVMPLCEQLTDKRQETAARLRALPPPRGSSQLCPAVLAALAVLDQDARHNERELHIVSDTQLLPWSRFRKTGGADKGARAADAAAEEGQWDPAKVRESTTCFVTLLGASVPENVSPVEVEIEPKLVTPQTSCRVTVRFLRSGPSLDTAAALVVDGKEVARRSVPLVAGNGNLTTFVIPPLGPGIHAVRVETPDDSLTLDNPFHALVRVREKLPALCVGSPEHTLFLRAALQTTAGGVTPFDIKTVDAEGLAAESLDAYSCIFLCDALPLAGQDIKKLERYAAGGGLLVMFPGDGCAMADYGAWTCLPALPVSVMDVPVLERKRLLSWEKPLHPVVKALKEGGISPTVAIRRQLKCDPLKDKSEILVSTGAGYPFLLTRAVGRGAVMLFTVPADRSWSDFPLSPFFLPAVHQMLHYAAGVGVAAPYIWATDSLPLDECLPEATRESLLKDPEGKPVSLQTTVVDGETVSYAEGLTAPGIYTLSRSGGTGDVPALAVNLSRGESDLTPVKAEEVPSILGLKTVHVATGKEELLKKIEDLRVGKTLGELLLWLVLLVALLESLYSNILMRKGSKLTDALLIAPSGKVTDKTP